MSVVISQTHIHEYERSKDNKLIYRCVHPKCTHYQNRQFLQGKEALCFKCKNPFILTWSQLRRRRPVCDFCSKSPKAKILRELRENAFKDLNLLDDETKKQILDETLE